MTNSPVIPAAIKLLDSWGVNVTVLNSASSNGRPGTFTPTGVVRHHTASSTTSTASASLSVIVNGRPDVPGPLSQFFISRGGVITCISYGRANHAGYGGPWRTVPKDDGNGFLVGVEMDNNGLGEAYQSLALRNARLLDAALLIIMKKDPSWLIGHKEWAPGRKIDPLLDMNTERNAVGVMIREKMNPTSGLPPAYTSYTVARGDSLWEIADRNATTVAILTKLNGLVDANDLDVGQVLRIPALASYVVQRGDTLTSIAEKFGVEIEAIVKVNGLANPDDIQLGERLRIPPRTT